MCAREFDLNANEDHPVHSNANDDVQIIHSCSIFSSIFHRNCKSYEEIGVVNGMHRNSPELIITQLHEFRQIASSIHKFRSC